MRVWDLVVLGLCWSDLTHRKGRGSNWSFLGHEFKGLVLEIGDFQPKVVWHVFVTLRWLCSKCRGGRFLPRIQFGPE